VGCTFTPRTEELSVWEKSGTLLKGKGFTDSESSFEGTKGLLKMPKNIEIDEGSKPLFIRTKSSIELFITGYNQLSNNYSFIHSHEKFT
jgi:hypothetical protein